MKIKYLIIIILFPINIFAQVKGIVLDENNEALPGATLVWEGTTIGGVTDIDGNFEIEISEKSNILTVAYIGYKIFTIQVDDPNEFLKIVLKLDTKILNEVVIAKKQGTVNMRTTILNTQKITSDELCRAACCNLSESFETNPSVDVSYSDAATGAKQIKLLGLSGTYVQMMTENIPNLKGIASIYGLSYIPGTWMESISISKGTGSVINGYESITGQINVEYKKPPTADKLFINLFASEAARVEANVDAAFRVDSALSTGILLHYSDEFWKQDRNKDNFLDMPMVRQFNGINRWYYHKGDYISQLFLKGMYEKRMGGQINVETPYQIDIETQRYEFFIKNGYVFNKEKEQSMGWIISGSWHKQDAFVGLNSYNGKQLSLYSNLIFQTMIVKNHKISTGWSINYDKFDENLINSQFVALPNGSGDVALYPYNFSNKKNEFVTGIFAEYTYNLNEKFVLLAGIRGDYNAFYKKFLVTPRLHLKYSPIEHINLRANIGKGYRSANILAENNNFLASNRRFDIMQNSMFEDSWNGGITAQFHIPIKKRELSIVAEYFYTQFQNQVVVDFDKDAHEVNIYALNGRDTYFDGNAQEIKSIERNGKSYSHNFQVEVSMEVIRDFKITAAYRFTDAKQTINGELREKPFTPRWRTLLTMSYATKLNKWQFDYTLQANGGGRLADPDNTNPLWNREFKPFLINNAQVTKNYKKWSFYLGCENIFNFVQKNPIIDVENPFSENFDATMIWGPTHGRKVYAGIRFRL